LKTLCAVTFLGSIFPVIGVLKGAVKSLQAIAGVSVNIIDIEKPGVGADACGGDGFHKSTRKKPTKGGEGRKTTPNERNSLAFDSSMERKHNGNNTTFRCRVFVDVFNLFVPICICRARRISIASRESIIKMKYINNIHSRIYLYYIERGRLAFPVKH